MDCNPGVAIGRSEEQIRNYLSNANYATIIQEYAWSLASFIYRFIYRYPDEARGRIFSITDKRLPVLIGDGHHKLEHLILRDDRAVCMADLLPRECGQIETSYRTLFAQWRIAHAIGGENRKRGAQPASISELARLPFEV